MKEKKFDENVEVIFSSLSDEEKAEYLSKENSYWNKVRNVLIVITIISSIITIIVTIGWVRILPIQKTHAFGVPSWFLPFLL